MKNLGSGLGEPVSYTIKDIPAHVWVKIQERAQRNDRSINKEIINILKRQK